MRLTIPLLISLAFPGICWADKLIVVEDRGGTSALRYFQDLVPVPNEQQAREQILGVQGAGAFPVTSAHLTPGEVQERVINAPGLQPMFIVGDDELSRTWLRDRGQQLRELQAVGVVVNVATADRFATVRSWASGLEMVPAPGDDLAARLGIQHYPLLITATTLQQ